jgi:Holliday junction resolvase RusA-like endonuclease
MKEIIFSVNIPVGAKSKKNKMRYWKGRVVKDPSITIYEAILEQAFKTYTGSPVDFPVSLEVVFCWNDRRRRDLQNALDVLLDVAQGIIYKDDSQIDYISAKKQLGCVKSNIEFKIYRS